MCSFTFACVRYVCSCCDRDVHASHKLLPSSERSWAGRQLQCPGAAAIGDDDSTERRCHQSHCASALPQLTSRAVNSRANAVLLLTAKSCGAFGIVTITWRWARRTMIICSHLSSGQLRCSAPLCEQAMNPAQACERSRAAPLSKLSTPAT